MINDIQDKIYDLMIDSTESSVKEFQCQASLVKKKRKLELTECSSETNSRLRRLKIDLNRDNLKSELKWDDEEESEINTD